MITVNGTRSLLVADRGVFVSGTRSFQSLTDSGRLSITIMLFVNIDDRGETLQGLYYIFSLLINKLLNYGEDFGIDGGF